MTSTFRVILLLLLLAAPAVGQKIDLAPPGQRDFVRDLADMIDKADEAKIIAIADQLLTDKATPIIVITIESMAHYGGPNMSIETFGHLLFDQWGVGQAKINGQSWNTGILLLIARDDRKARIQLGYGYRHAFNRQAHNIMATRIVANFKQRRFSQGILEGVEALDQMARGKIEQLPSSRVPATREPMPGEPTMHPPMHRQVGVHGGAIFTIAVILFIAFIIITIIKAGQSSVGRMTRRGSSVLGDFMYRANRRNRQRSGRSSSSSGGGFFTFGGGSSRGHSHSTSSSSGGGFFGSASGGGVSSGGGWSGSSGGGSFGGGSFGGGFSGGGGASGSW